jgi:hypothetical protein
MIQVEPYLFVGDEDDAEKLLNNFDNEPKWSIVHACKEPYHRNELGYQGRGAPQNHKEYYFAKRDRRLILNLIDAPLKQYIPKTIIDEALMFITAEAEKGQQILVHCNQGESRGPGIAMLYVALYDPVWAPIPTDQLEEKFREKYPKLKLGQGMKDFIYDYLSGEEVKHIERRH